MRFLRIFALFLTALAGSAVVHAASFLVPPDRELVRRADAIVIGVVTDAHSKLDPAGRIVTVATLAVDEALKGSEIGSTIEVTELGGIVGDRGLAVSGSPGYQPGEKVLAFLERRNKGFRTWGMLLGKFNFATDSIARELLVRGAGEGYLGWKEGTWEPYVEHARSRERFTSFVREAARGLDPPSDYFLEPLEKIQALTISPMNHTPAAAYARGSTQPTATRWKRFDNGQAVNYTASGGANGEQQTAASSGIGLWKNDGTSNMDSANYSGTSSDPFDVDQGSGSDGKNTIIFNSSRSELGGSTVGYAAWSYQPPNGTNIKNGSDFGTIFEGDILIEVGLTGNVLRQVVAHEVGHTLGFRHSNQPNPGEPSSTNAIMNSSASGITSLQTWDREAANHVYGDATFGGGPPPCTAPSIAVQPQNQTITSGNSATLSVSASGTSPFSYQWFRGSSGDASQPIAGATSSSFNTGSLTSTTSYWVRVTGQCGSPANSNTATITVTSCTPPSITQQPLSTNITSGQAAVLSVTASGSATLTYAWYRGPVGSTSFGILSTSRNFNTGPLAQTDTFWVRVSNGCGSADSALATVTVSAACLPPKITQQPQSTSVQASQSATLTIGATGTSLIIEWFRGNSGDTSSGVLGIEPSFDTGPLTSTSSFWVRVSNACGTVDSSLATVTVGSRRRSVRR